MGRSLGMHDDIPRRGTCEFPNVRSHSLALYGGRFRHLTRWQMTFRRHRYVYTSSVPVGRRITTYKHRRGDLSASMFGYK